MFVLGPGSQQLNLFTTHRPEAALSIIRSKGMWMRNTKCLADYREVGISAVSSMKHDLKQFTVVQYPKRSDRNWSTMAEELRGRARRLAEAVHG